MDRIHPLKMNKNGTPVVKSVGVDPVMAAVAVAVAVVAVGVAGIDLEVAAEG